MTRPDPNPRSTRPRLWWHGEEYMTRRREGVGAFRGPMTFVGTVLLLVVVVYAAAAVLG